MNQIAIVEDLYAEKNVLYVEEKTAEHEMNNNSDDEDLKVLTVPIGKPLDNTKILILDKFANLQPIGVIGELYVLGHGVASSYLNNKDFSDQHFVPCPYFEDQYMYRTGDLGKWNLNGEITYLGRKDNQIKIRGYRIELTEIEHHIRTYETVNEVVVRVRKEKDNKYLVAYVMSNIEIEPSVMMSYLSDKLPDYMIPSFYVPIDSIPLNSNGKVDRKALPAPEMKPAKNYQPPSNEIEEKLVDIWSKVLKMDKKFLGTADNFFEIGGHSLLIMDLTNKINACFKMELLSKELFIKPTIKQQASFIKQKTKSKIEIFI